MKKEFLTYEQSLALKELGFNEPCFLCYRGKNDLYRNGCGGYLSDMSMEINSSLDNYEINKQKQYWIAAPLKQQAFTFFREKYNLSGCILGDGFISFFEGYYYSIKEDGWINFYESIEDEILFKTYEEAEQACLDKLIEIAKKTK